MKKTLIFLLLILSFVCVGFVKAETQDELNAKIEQLEKNIAEAQGQAKTLAGQIAYYDSQIELANLKIKQTEDQINIFSNKINSLENALQERSVLLKGQIVRTYKNGPLDGFQVLLSSGDVSELISHFKYLQIVQENNRKFLHDTQVVQTNYKQQKDLIETSKKKLESQKASLAVLRTQRDSLLTQTKNSEVNYQKQLSQAIAQLASLSSFSQSVGSSLIPHKDLSDGWGKYFNQRDSQWGLLLVNNDHSDCRGGPCTLAAIGCLATSYTMVVSHFGGSLIPSDVAINPSNFYGNTANFNNPGPSANGHAPTRMDNPSIQQLKDALNSGAVVIAGMSKNGGPYPVHYSDHWVVLRSVEGDSFRINDPLYENGMNALLKDHYLGWAIIQANIYH